MRKTRIPIFFQAENVRCLVLIYSNENVTVASYFFSKETNFEVAQANIFFFQHFWVKPPKLYFRRLYPLLSRKKVPQKMQPYSHKCETDCPKRYAMFRLNFIIQLISFIFCTYHHSYTESKK